MSAADTSFTRPTGMAGSAEDKSAVGAAVERGGARIAAAAQTASGDLADDISKLRADMASMQDTVSKFMSRAGGETAKSMRDVGNAVAAQVGSVANDAVEAGAEMAAQAKDQIKTFASELEGATRKNPLGTLAATLLVGVVIGMMSRGRG